MVVDFTNIQLKSSCCLGGREVVRMKVYHVDVTLAAKVLSWFVVVIINQ